MRSGAGLNSRKTASGIVNVLNPTASPRAASLRWSTSVIVKMV